MSDLKKKGVSPVIATVLLVALVIVIALIIFLFMRGIGEEAITKFGSENIKLACNKVEFDASYSNEEIAVSNLGEAPIYDLNVKLVQKGSYETVNFREIDEDWPSAGLTQGGVASASIPNAGELDLQKIVINPILVGKTKSGAKKTYSCEQGSYESEIVVI